MLCELCTHGAEAEEGKHLCGECLEMIRRLLWFRDEVNLAISPAALEPFKPSSGHGEKSPIAIFEAAASK